MGSDMPSDAAKVTTRIRVTSPPSGTSEAIDAPSAAMIGINKLAVAVWDIKFAIIKHRKAAPNSTT